LGLPTIAKIRVEAYYGTSSMNFSFGTVRRPAAPKDTTLTEIPPGALPRFRIKVVGDGKDRGRILALADRVVPLKPEDDSASPIPLLPVHFRGLGDRIWRLDLEDGPVLELNREVSGIANLARSDPSFLALVYPEIVRCVLTEIVIENDHTDPLFDEDDWMSLWLCFAGRLPGIALPPPSGRSQERLAEKREWIEQAVQAFCEGHKTRARLEEILGGDWE